MQSALARELRRFFSRALVATFLVHHVALSHHPSPARVGRMLAPLHAVAYAVRKLPLLLIAYLLGWTTRSEPDARQDPLWTQFVREMLRFAFRTFSLKAFRLALRVGGVGVRTLMGLDRYLKRVTCAGVPCTFVCLDSTVEPQDANLLVYFHGGGYCCGYNEMYMGSFYKICSEMNLAQNRCSAPFGILTVEYALSPEARFPTALNQALEVYKWCLFHCSRAIFLGGDSAGGNLAISCSLKALEESLRKPDGLVLISPWTDLTPEAVPDSEKYTRDYVLKSTIRLFADAYLGHLEKKMYDEKNDEGTYLDVKKYNATHPLVSVSRASTESLQALPAPLIIVGQGEVLYPQIVAFHKKIKGRSRLMVLKNGIHISAVCYPVLDDGTIGAKAIVEYLSERCVSD